MIRVAILTISDSAASGAREDLSGPILQEHCEKIGWQTVATAVVRDDANAIAEQLSAWADSATASLILTTGGTGISPRDVTPEATRSVIDREIPGLAELMRAKGLEQSKFSPLSRAVAGWRKTTLIVNLPGSPRGALHSLQTIADLVPHMIDLLKSRTQH